jgi:membrane protease subunit (stomatin/prohibitin family)
MAIIDFVKWDNYANEMVWKFPSQELSTWTQLIINESQEAVVVKEGVFDGPFSAGRHTLETKNIPGLTTLIGIPFGGNSPFTAEVWYFNKSINLNIKWGTADPIQIEDPKYKTLLPVRAYGQYGIRVQDSKRFLKYLIGTKAKHTFDELRTQLKGILTTKVKSIISSSIFNSGVSIFEISSHLDRISKEINSHLSESLKTYGLEAIDFSVESISVPEDDLAVKSLKSALAKKAEMGIVGFTYQQEKSFEVLNSAASNDGASGAIINSGIGLGVGLGVVSPITTTFKDVVQNIDNKIPSAATNVALNKEKLELIKELSNMAESGLLTRAEFEQEKSKILKGENG